MKDRDFLLWLHERLVKVHGESPYYDYMHRFREIIAAIPVEQHATGKVATMVSMDMLKEIRQKKLSTKAKRILP